MTIYLPDKCLRQRTDCTPYSQIQSDCKVSFICCGVSDPSTRTVAQDNFRLCWKNSVIDEMTDWDKRDLLDTMSVMAQTLSIDANINCEI